MGQSQGVWATWCSYSSGQKAPGDGDSLPSGLVGERCEQPSRHPGSRRQLSVPAWEGYIHVLSLPAAMTNPAPMPCQVSPTACPPGASTSPSLLVPVVSLVTLFFSWGTHFRQKMVKIHGQSVAHGAQSFACRPSSSITIIVPW